MTVLTHQPSEAKVPPASTRRPPPAFFTVSNVRRVGIALLVLQLIGFGYWSWVVYGRFDLTADAVFHFQAWYLIAHGHLNPFISSAQESYIDDHGEILTWVFAPLYWIYSSGVLLLWLQDLVVIVAEFVALMWICEFCGGEALSRPADVNDAPRAGASWWPPLLAALGLVMLVANPWYLWGISFDFHMIAFGGCFALLAAYDVAHGHNRRCWLWVVLTIACGDVAATYVFGVALSALLAGKSTRRKGLELLALSVAAFGAISALHLDRGDVEAGVINSGHQSVISSLANTYLRHPSALISRITAHRWSLYANVVASGGIGVFSAWGFGVPAVVLFESSLIGGAGVAQFSLPWQDIVVYPFITIGSVFLAAALIRRVPRLAAALCVVLLISSIGWAAEWYPKDASQWLRATPAASVVLEHALSEMTPADEVAVEQGVAGRFSFRRRLHLIGSRYLAITSRRVWVVLAPVQGIETVLPSTALGYATEFATLPGIRVRELGAGIAVLFWQAPARIDYVGLPPRCATYPGWALAGVAGTPHVNGNAATWATVFNGRAGYVVDGADARPRPGSYQASVRLATTGALSVEVWDDTRDELLARRQIPPSPGLQTIDVPFVAPRPLVLPTTEGIGPFRIQQVAPPQDDQIEVRVFTPGGATGSIRSISVDPLVSGRSHPQNAGSCAPTLYVPKGKNKSVPIRSVVAH